MHGKGFYLQRGILGAEFVQPDFSPEVELVRSKDDDVLDLVFQCDPVTGWPMSSYQAYLSDKTSDEVRSFIEKTLLKEHSFQDYPSDIKQDLQSIDSDFMVKCCRNQYETIEEYESRVSSYLDDITHDEEVSKRIKELEKRLMSKSE